MFGQTLEEYINSKYDGSEMWFEKEVEEQQVRILKVFEYKNYLNGVHKILNKPNIQYKNKEFATKKTVFNEIKNILDFSTIYLLGKKPSFIGSENKVKLYNNIYRKGKYSSIDYKILDKVKKYGDLGEYIYPTKDKRNKKGVASYIIQSEDFYPIYSDTFDYVGAIEHWTHEDSKVSYYRVYYGDKVEFWDNEGGYGLTLRDIKTSYGLPVHWHNLNDGDERYGRSEIEDIKGIIDDLEGIINRLGDAVHTIITNPILHIDGELKGDDNTMNVDGIGYAIATDGGKVDYPYAQMDYDCIKLYLDTLKEELHKIGAIPSAIYGQSNVANISETVIKQLYQIASNRASINEMWMREGLEQRWEVIDTILEECEGIEFNDDEYIDIEFNYSRPANDSETVDNIVKLREIKAMSQRDSIEASPLTSDVNQTVERLEEEELKEVKENNGNSGVNDNVNQSKDNCLQ
ncbi:phage portal protein [Clostridium brassicae]|uniref:Phage portal protein n=1 Tax=Clostridium brassicae TaxID=2999072 RepID=A0ABT4D9G3_9CLOT|nr:phage portal protein [Clostridium brassicae]MCY6958278.1 phage portal protein [Clostridium brassicae]